eukprot:375810-Amphidinium_carterae.1
MVSTVCGLGCTPNGLVPEFSQDTPRLNHLPNCYQAQYWRTDFQGVGGSNACTPAPQSRSVWELCAIP